MTWCKWSQGPPLMAKSVTSPQVHGSLPTAIIFFHYFPNHCKVALTLVLLNVFFAVKPSKTNRLIH